MQFTELLEFIGSMPMAIEFQTILLKTNWFAYIPLGFCVKICICKKKKWWGGGGDPNLIDFCMWCSRDALVAWETQEVGTKQRYTLMPSNRDKCIMMQLFVFTNMHRTMNL